MVDEATRSGTTRRRAVGVALAACLLGGCAMPPGGAGEVSARDVPEAVLAVAAPYQDLETVRLRPDDGCYWYRHVGPVETTLLPLRTVDGRPICARPQA